MVELTHRSRLTGGGLKPPKVAVVKSHGIIHLINIFKGIHEGFAVERLGKGFTTSKIRYG